MANSNDQTTTSLILETRTVLQGFHVVHEFWLSAYPDVVIRAKSPEEARRWLAVMAVFLMPAGTKIHEVTFTTLESERRDRDVRR